MSAWSSVERWAEPRAGMFGRLVGWRARASVVPETAEAPHVAVVCGRGDLTRDGQLQEVYGRCRHALEMGVDSLLVDLSGVTRMDSKAVAMLSAVAQRARRVGVVVEVRCPAELREWMRVCRVERFFRFAE